MAHSQQAFHIFVISSFILVLIKIPKNTVVSAIVLLTRTQQYICVCAVLNFCLLAANIHSNIVQFCGNFLAIVLWVIVF